MSIIKEYLSGDLEQKRAVKFDLFIFVLIFLSCGIFILENSTVPKYILSYTRIFDFIFNIIFSLEIILRFIFSHNRKKFFKSTYTWIDFLAILPFWLGAGNFLFVRALRFVRVFRFLRFFKFSKKYFTYHEVGHSKTEIEHSKNFQNVFFIKVFFSIFLFIYIFASVIYFVEHDYNSQINQFSDALYFIWISVLAVGYGDIVPVTQIGKLITMIGTLIGVSIIPFQLGNFIRISNENRHKKDSDFIKVNYKFCPHCGENIPDEIKTK